MEQLNPAFSIDCLDDEGRQLLAERRHRYLTALVRYTAERAWQRRYSEAHGTPSVTPDWVEEMRATLRERRSELKTTCTDLLGMPWLPSCGMASCEHCYCRHAHHFRTPMHGIAIAVRNSIPHCGECDCVWCNPDQVSCDECNCTTCYSPDNPRLCEQCDCAHCYPEGRDCEDCDCDACYPGGRDCGDCGCRTCYPNGRGCEDSSCEECYSQDDDDSDVLHCYDYKPRPVFARVPDEPRGLTSPHHTTRYYGLEVEAEQAGSPTACYAAAANVTQLGKDRIYCKTDGSLDCGIEAVSHPGSFLWWCAQPDPLPWAQYLRKIGYRAYQTTSCGLHIHVSRNAISETALAKLLVFVGRHHDLFARLSRRQQTQLNTYARIETDKPSQVIAKVKRNTDLERYTAINLCPSKTVEVRLFRGTLATRGIMRNLALVDSLLQWCEQVTLCQLISPESVQHYTAFVFDLACRSEGKAQEHYFDVYTWVYHGPEIESPSRGEA